jgi:hypothetical protein
MLAMALSSLAQAGEPATPSVAAVMAALKRHFDAFDRLEIHYTTTEAKLYGDEIRHCQLRIAGDRFWFNQTGREDGSFFYDQIAFDGRHYGRVEADGDAMLETKLFYIYPEEIISAPIFGIFEFLLPVSTLRFNPLPYYHDPKTWAIAARTAKLGPIEIVDKVPLQHLSITNLCEETFQVDLRPDLDYFPTHWQFIDRDGSRHTLVCSSFQTFDLGKRKLIFPTALTSIHSSLNNKFSRTIQTKVETITPLDHSATADFQLELTRIRRLFDHDSNHYVKNIPAALQPDDHASPKPTP